MQILEHRALYAAFDRFPASKGAAHRIRRVAAALFEAAGGGVLFTLGSEALPLYQRLAGASPGAAAAAEGLESCAGEVEVLRFGGGDPLLRRLPNLLDRALAFGARLSQVMASQPSLEVCQFRDPWSGLPILTCPRRRGVAVYEINGLPSIELPDAYPRLPGGLRARLRAAERFCWSAADWVITPSRTMRDNLVALGVPAAKIRVVANGAEPPAGSAAAGGRALRPAGAPRRYLLYFGALQGWQGVDVLLRAFALLRDFEDLGLVICAAGRTRRARALERLAERVAPSGRVLWRFGLSDAELAPWVAHAELSVAPLTECPRNLEQGCLPLKVLESMAAGVPVVASDLPSLREVIDDGVDGRLVRPDRPSELARALRVLLESPRARLEMAARARRKAAERYGWERGMGELRGWYGELLGGLGGAGRAAAGDGWPAALARRA
ncbi:MAG TPA: glycosyltransferase family 4 protein [Thermoanaerobaculia bacterium]|nr:glycosyltransferase family 4 protein [Thermoanaerobaculia bacterium]